MSYRELNIDLYAIKIPMSLYRPIRSARHLLYSIDRLNIHDIELLFLYIYGLVSYMLYDVRLFPKQKKR